MMPGGALIWCAAKSGVFDPATLDFAGWWRPAYAGSPYAGVASAGASGGRNLTESTNPPAVGNGGRALGGFDTPDLDGTNDVLNSALNTSSFYSSATGFAAVLFNADTAQAAGSEAYNSPGFVSDPGGPTTHLGFADNGIWGTVYNGSAWVKPSAIACATGAWHWAFMWWVSGTLRIQLDRGSPNSVAIGGGGTVSLGSNPLLVGKTPIASKFFDGRFGDIMLASVDHSAQIGSIVDYGNARYGLSL